MTMTNSQVLLHDQESDCGGSWKPDHTVKIPRGSSVEILEMIPQKGGACWRIRWQGQVGYTDGGLALEPLPLTWTE